AHRRYAHHDRFFPVESGDAVVRKPRRIFRKSLLHEERGANGAVRNGDIIAPGECDRSVAMYAFEPEGVERGPLRFEDGHGATVKQMQTEQRGEDDPGHLYM